MNIAIILAALTALSTFAGGALALKSKDRLHLVLFSVYQPVYF